MSLPEELLSEFDSIVEKRRYASRSSAIGDLLHQTMVDHKSQKANQVMAGVVTLLYENSVSGVRKRLADIQLRHIDEVISSLHVHLMHDQTMEVILVQGPAGVLRGIADELISQRGVISGKMHLVAAIIPQVHPFTGERPSKQGKPKYRRDESPVQD